MALRGDARRLKLLAAGIMDERLQLVERPGAQIAGGLFSVCVANGSPTS
ncbi:hypothetical protein [Streptomyces rubiginosohelvolus]